MKVVVMADFDWLVLTVKEYNKHKALFDNLTCITGVEKTRASYEKIEYEAAGPCCDIYTDVAEFLAVVNK